MIVLVFRSSVAHVSSHKVAEFAATSATVSSRPIHHPVAGGLSLVIQSVSSHCAT